MPYSYLPGPHGNHHSVTESSDSKILGQTMSECVCACFVCGHVCACEAWLCDTLVGFLPPPPLLLGTWGGGGGANSRPFPHELGWSWWGKSNWENFVCVLVYMYVFRGGRKRHTPHAHKLSVRYIQDVSNTRLN